MRLISFPLLLTLSIILYSKPLISGEENKPSSTTESFKHWVVICNSVKNSQNEVNDSDNMLCEIKTSVSVKEQNGNIRSLLSINIGQMPGEEDLTILFQVPPGVFLRSDVVLHQIEGEQLKDQPLLNASYFRCDKNQCLADTTLTEDMLDVMTAEKQFQTLFVDAGFNRIGVPISMDGFKGALSSLLSK